MTSVSFLTRSGFFVNGWGELREEIDNVMSLMSVKADNIDVEVISFIDPLVPNWLSGDPTRLKQVIVNQMRIAQVYQ